MNGEVGEGCIKELEPEGEERQCFVWDKDEMR